MWTLYYIIFYLTLFTVGNKNDDPDRKIVLTEDAQRFADQMNINLFETSAKENINVEEVIIYKCICVNVLKKPLLSKRGCCRYISSTQFI